MTGKTHQSGGALGMMLGYIWLRNKGLTIPNCNDYVQLFSMYPWSIWGAKASDIDHNESSNPCKDFLSVVLNKALHISKPAYERYKEKLDSDRVSPREKRHIRLSFGFKVASFFNARHRSWQTHSDVSLIFLVSLVSILQFLFTLSSVDLFLLNLIQTGAIFGMISHLLLDALTTEGIHLLIFRFINKTLLAKSKIQLPETLHLVPKSKLFSCESSWEGFVRWVLNVSTGLAFIYLILDIENPELLESVFSFTIQFIKEVFS